MEIRTGWIVLSALVLLVGGASIFVLAKERRFHLAQFVSLAVLMYFLLVLILWGTTSTYLFKSQIAIPATLKRLLLASAGGLLAQVAVSLNRVTRGKDKSHAIAPIYLDAVTGILSGVAAAALLATTKDNFTAISDQQAAVAGVAGGALGLSFFDVIKRFLPGLAVAKDAGEPLAFGGGSKRATCMYAGQAYSHGASIAMPARGGTVVKTCDGKTGGWKTEDT